MDPATPPTVAAPFKSLLPGKCQTFTLFLRLPAEIRNNIWEAYLSEPGIDFVKLEMCGSGWKSKRAVLARTICLEIVNVENEDDIDETGGGLDALDLKVIEKDFSPRPVVHAKLVPQSSNWKADASHFEVLYRQLAILSKTCTESAALVESLVSRPGVLRMENGNILTLDRSPDLVLLDYLPLDVYIFNFTLDIRLFCPGLDLIRRVAVRYSSCWKPIDAEQIASSTGAKAHAETENYPVHLFQFLARCLPNLEEFYLVDYYTVIKREQQGQASTDVAGNATPSRPLNVFRAKDRKFCEVIEGEASTAKWNIEREIFAVRDWLQGRFVRYAKASHTSRHKKPESVYFGVLACDWNVQAPISRFASGNDTMITTPWGPRSSSLFTKREARPPISKPIPLNIATDKMKVYVGHRPLRGGPSVSQNQASMFSLVMNMPRLEGLETCKKFLKWPSRHTGVGVEKTQPADEIFEFGASRNNAFSFTFRQPYGDSGQRKGV